MKNLFFKKMRKNILKIVSGIISMLFVLLLISSCSEQLDDSSVEVGLDGDYSSLSISGDATSSGGSSQGQGNNSGLVTAGEWNDLENWNFWKELLNQNTYFEHIDYWGFYTKNRVSVKVTNNGNPLINTEVVIKHNTEEVWKSKTDVFGNSELWINLFNNENVNNLEEFKLYINGEENSTPLKLIEDGVVEIELSSNSSNASNTIELAFIVDATGSMSDELEFLKDDLKDVIQRVKQNNSALDIYTGTVFYRDIQDEYLVKHSSFTNQIDETLSFINNQFAGGGGDYPEAVHTALNEALVQLQWSTNSKNRIAFLLLDAPPHYTTEVVENLKELITSYAAMGINIIPITASGIDKETEFLMRFFSVVTNGTYVFITNDSGIGGNHIEASVGEYEVEQLNDLLVRLIDKYSGSAIQ